MRKKPYIRGKVGKKKRKGRKEENWWLKEKVKSLFVGNKVGFSGKKLGGGGGD